MNNSATKSLLFLLVWFGLCLFGLPAWAQQVVTYQGSLKDGGVAATGLYDIQFTLYDAPAGGVVVDGPITREDVPVQDGVFTTQLSFAPGAFNGQDRWLEVALRDGASTGAFQVLQPRQAITGSPQAHVSLSVAPDSVDTLALQNGAVTGPKIATGAVGADAIATDAVGGVELAATGVTAGSYGSATEVATFTVDSDGRLTAAGVQTISGIAPGGAAGGDLTGTYPNPQLADNTVTGATVADGSITAADVDSSSIQVRVSDSCTGGEKMVSVNADGSVNCAPDTTGNDWSLNGNAITAGQFFGTTNNQPLELAVNNSRVLRIEPETASDGPNWLGGYSGNSITAGVVGGTIAGGGAPDDGAGGPDNNRITDHYGTIGGGWGNQAGDGDGFVNNRRFATVSGGYYNIASGSYSTVSGGLSNTATASYGTVGGGWSNTANGLLSTLSGGYDNISSGTGSAVSGGVSNVASGQYAVISGGSGNAASNYVDTVGGGSGNTANGTYATVSGGNINTASGQYSAITGGNGNVASGGNASVGGGRYNSAVAWSSTVPGGQDNQAGGEFSFAAGYRAKVRNAVASGDSDGDEGTFVWADVQNVDFTSTGPNQFLVRASGGVGLGTNAPQNQLHVRQNVTGSTVETHVVQIENSNAGIEADGLAIKLGTGIPLPSNNFISFYTGTDTLVGQIEGNSIGGISYNTSGADFAEYLPAGDENLHPGEVAALKQGKLWRSLEDAERVFVISTAPAFKGNAQTDTSGMALAAFMGQVPVKVKGPVQPGDWLLAAGKGQAVAVKADQLAQADLRLVVGRALKPDENGQALVLVGLPPQGVQQALQQQLATQQSRIAQLEQDNRQLLKLKRQLADQQAEIARLKQQSQQLRDLKQQLAEMEVLVRHLLAAQAAQRSNAAVAGE